MEFIQVNYFKKQKGVELSAKTDKKINRGTEANGKKEVRSKTNKL